VPGFNGDGSEVDRVLQRSPSIESGRWFGEDQRANIITKDTCSKEIGLRLRILIIIPHFNMGAQLGGPMYPVYKINKIKGGSIFNLVFIVDCFIVDSLISASMGKVDHILVSKTMDFLRC
jgi:hypothetical protein